MLCGSPTAASLALLCCTAVSALTEAASFFLLFFSLISVISVVLGFGGMIWENGTETCIISYVKRIASPGSMHDTGCLGLVHWDDPEGWDGEEGGRGLQDGEHMYTHGGFMSMYGKNQYNIVK